MADKSITNPDFIIVGSGASGAAISWRLGKAGFKVVCIEQGPQINIESYPHTKKDWEIKAQHEWNNNPNIRSLTEDYPVNDQDSEISPLMFNAVGGSTIHWTAHAPRFHPSDFKVKSLDGVADDWPISYKDLEPYYDLNDEIMGCSGINGDPANPIRKKRPMPPIPLGEDGVLIAKAFDKLGWHWWPSDTAIISEDYDGRAKCINLSPCNSGCSQGAKSSVDVAYWHKNLRKRGVELKTRCRVREILVDEKDRAKGVIYYDENGVECRQFAEIVIIACNGIGTPRILLNSKSKYFPDGLSNRSGMVGKNLMFHPWGRVEGTFEEMLDSHLGPQGSCVLSHEFYETDQQRGFLRGYTLQVVRGQPPVNIAKWGYKRGAVPWGTQHHESFQKYYGKQIQIEVCCEDLPEISNTVTLDTNLKDCHGIPAPKITYQLSDNSRKMLNHGLEQARIALEAAGATETYSHGQVRESGWHNMGTARMGLDPDNSVVNEWGQSHDVKNLFIIDGSVFVTSGAVNPTTTIQALALYISDQIKNNITTIFS